MSYYDIFSSSRKPIIPCFFPLFICHTVCFAKMNIPTELTPIWQGWHEADGCSSYVERCYRRLTVKSCYLNSGVLAQGSVSTSQSPYTWIRVCEGHWFKIEDVKLFNSRGKISGMTFPPSGGLYNLNIANINGEETKLELFWEHFSSVQFEVPLPWWCWKSDALVRAEGIGPPLIHSLPRHLLPFCLRYSVFHSLIFMFWSAFFSQCCAPD